MKKIISIIWGKGSMWKYYANIFRKIGFTVLVSDIWTKLTNTEASRKGDYVMIATPIDKTVWVINEIRDSINPNACIFDITSVKASPVEAMLKTKAKEVVWIHPMHSASVTAKGQVYVFCKWRWSKGYIELKKIFKKQWALIEEIDVIAHDKMMSVIQWLSHFSDIVLAKTLEKLKVDLKKHLKFQSPPYKLKFEMMWRILAQNANLYGNIQLANDENVKVIKRFIESANELFDINQKKDLNWFIKYFDDSKKFLWSYAEKALIESNKIIKKCF